MTFLVFSFTFLEKLVKSIGFFVFMVFPFFKFLFYCLFILTSLAGAQTEEMK